MIATSIPGPLNLITDVGGLRVGNAHDDAMLTGVTVLLPDESMVAAVDIRGGAPGSRETPALEPENLVEGIHGIVLSGGSVFGLEAASAVAWRLAQQGTGYCFGDQPWACPVVPAAILFDLMNGGGKDWGDGPPYAALASRAFDAASTKFALGNAGAGMGAVAGAIKGGLGSASALYNGFTVGALVAVNSAGSCGDARTGRLWAQDHAVRDEMGKAPRRSCPELGRMKFETQPGAATPGANTTIGIVATDAQLTKAEAKRLAIMAADGLAMAIRPLHTPFDGDTVFAVSTGRLDLPQARPLVLAGLGAMAATSLARAVGRAIWMARSSGRFRCYRDLIGA